MLSQENIPVFIVLSFIVLGVSLSFAIGYLISQFRSGNSVSTILIGWPQLAFYSLTSFACLIFFISLEAFGTTQFVGDFSSDPLLIVVKVASATVLYFFSLRLSVKTGKKSEIGPDFLFSMLLDNVEERIDQKKTAETAEKLTSLEKIPEPQSVINVVLPFCFDEVEKLKDIGSKKERLTNLLKSIQQMENIDLTQKECSLLMLGHLHKEFGFKVISSAIMLVSSCNLIPSSEETIREEDRKNRAEELESTSERLETLLSSLNERQREDTHENLHRR